MASLVQSSLVLATVRTTAQRPQARRTLVVRTTSEDSVLSTSGTFFYKGNSYAEEEWKRAVADGSVSQAAPTPTEFTTEAVLVAGKALSLGQLLAFGGPAPELINGRLAMLAFIAALGAELSSGESVLHQLGNEPTGVILTAMTFIAASLIPLLSSTKRNAFGPFTPWAEMVNGRAAMIGFSLLLACEAARGGVALF